jgi:hypothetical protein
MCIPKISRHRVGYVRQGWAAYLYKKRKCLSKWARIVPLSKNKMFFKMFSSVTDISAN